MSAKRNSGRRQNAKRTSSGGKAIDVANFIALRVVPGIVISAIVLGLPGYGLYRFFKYGDFFRVKQVVVNSDDPGVFAPVSKDLNKRYVGHNIFNVDVKYARRMVAKEHPELKKVTVRKVFPDVIEMDVVTRKPVAVIESGRGIVVDAENVVLGSDMMTPGLIKIKGISFFLNAPTKGEKIDNKALDAAVNLLRIIQNNKGLRKEGIDYIDVTDRNNLMVGISGATVKIGAEDLDGRIKRLGSILNDPAMDLKHINYIDLRFEDTVISPK
ncbi:MAG: FtsQ-type POTRA domain-containing protein [Candidatus Omnitrophica bacterium]|nr:FtsQ-type POTRA domain-containing protein [Candidatus Omnitrophota bacterium]MDD5488356.1 FtsQ-type POTRA domain-containing protein [Candidatus Omnitrophota bacterium]